LPRNLNDFGAVCLFNYGRPRGNVREKSALTPLKQKSNRSHKRWTDLMVKEGELKQELAGLRASINSPDQTRSHGLGD